MLHHRHILVQLQPSMLGKPSFVTFLFIIIFKNQGNLLTVKSTGKTRLPSTATRTREEALLYLSVKSWLHSKMHKSTLWSRVLVELQSKLTARLRACRSNSPTTHTVWKRGPQHQHDSLLVENMCLASNNSDRQLAHVPPRTSSFRRGGKSSRLAPSRPILPSWPQFLGQIASVIKTIRRWHNLALLRMRCWK